MILITGAAGFIGSACVWALNQRGVTDLILADSFGSREKWKNLRGLRFREFVDREDLFDALASAPWAREIKTVIHMGACADTTQADVDYLRAWNYDYSRILCEWSLENDVRFIYASSAAVYGNGSLGFSDRDDLTPKLRPLNAYGFSKWLFDMWVLEHKLQDKVAGLRFFNVFGPNEYHKDRMASVVLHAYPQARDTDKVRLFESHREDFGHGEQRRDFIHIAEVMTGIKFLLDKPNVNGIFNLGTGTPHTYNQLAENVCKALGKPVKIEYFPMPEDLRGRYQYETCADMSKFYAAGLPKFSDRFAEFVQSYVRDYMHADSKYLADV
ncbi:MAG: ADP-glyceromanno-heptose 6-epimerase [Calditrichaeota bacterium]|nr:ADP-glyceromanno-heptose 6-epimerase [Calditrichota bacterium]